MSPSGPVKVSTTNTSQVLLSVELHLECLISAAYITPVENLHTVNTSTVSTSFPSSTTTSSTTTEQQTDYSSQTTGFSSSKTTMPSVRANKPGSSSSKSRTQTNRIIAGVAVSLLIVIALLAVAIVTLGVFFYWRRRQRITYSMQNKKR